MIADDLCSKLIHSGTVGGFTPSDYIDLAPMLWSRPPRQNWLGSGPDQSLREALEHHVYIAETPDQRRQRQLFSHVRIAIPANIYTSLETRFPGDFPANIESELVHLHNHDLHGVQQHNCSVRYRIEPDADLPDDTVRYRFGVAIYVRGRGERAQWHIRFGKLGEGEQRQQVIPLHRDETAIIVGRELCQSSYSFRDWPLDENARLLITQKHRQDGARVMLKGISGIPDEGVFTRADGWTIVDNSGNQMILTYSEVPIATWAHESHTQMDASPRHAVFFKPSAQPASSGAQTPRWQHTADSNTAQQDPIAASIFGINGSRVDRSTTPPPPEHKPSGILIRGIALQRSAMPQHANGERRLQLESLLTNRQTRNDAGATLVLDRQNQLRLEHNGQTQRIHPQRPMVLPELELPLYPVPLALQPEYLGWLPLPQAILFSSLDEEALCQLEHQAINRIMAQHCQLNMPSCADTRKPSVAAQLLQKGDQLALRTCTHSSSYLLPRRDKSTSPIRGDCLPPLTTVVRDKAAAFTLICSQYVLEYCPAGTVGIEG